VLGASLGRLAGETLKLWFKHVDPAVYALIGSAAFSGGATQSISGTHACSHCTVYTHIHVILGEFSSDCCVHSYYEQYVHEVCTVLLQVGRCCVHTDASVVQHMCTVMLM
jgi:Voltage gated chloride channel